MKPIGLIDGKLVDLSEKVVSMEDRGYQFGDGVYEVTRVYNGHCFAIDLHWQRLVRSLEELRIPVPYTKEEIVQYHELMIKESGMKEAGVYLQITRGAAPRTHNFPAESKPCLTMAIRPTANHSASLQNGTKIIMIPDERWLRCDIKSLNLLGNILGKQKAKEAGCFEAVMLRDGTVTEGTSSNCFVVRDGVLWTHPANHWILKGITRTILVDKLIAELGLTLEEKTFGLDDVYAADEVFLTGTSTEVMPIIQVDNHAVGNGQVGAVTRKLQQAFTAYVDRECYR